METILIKYSEIQLKGKNKHEFVKKLISNIKIASKRQKLNLINIERPHDRIFCTFNNTQEEIKNCIINVFGIKFFAFVKEIERNPEAIKKYATEIISEFKKEKIERLGLKAKRSSKQFPLNSVQINTMIGDIASENKIKINFKNPQKIIYTEISSDKVVMYTKKIEAYSGLPIGTSGKTLCLLSGGIDSPVAAFCMMRRGIKVDFLHFHNYATNEICAKSKIKELVEILNKFQFKSTLHIIPYSVYEKNTMGKIHPRYELVFFKHYILKVAQKLAQKFNHDAIVTGDNLCQVASQTLENLKVVNKDIELPIFRPLLTYDKQEIIELAEKIGTYELSIEKYKDCCSIHSKNQTTKARQTKFDDVINAIDYEKLIDESIQNNLVLRLGK